MKHKKIIYKNQSIIINICIYIHINYILTFFLDNIFFLLWSIFFDISFWLSFILILIFYLSLFIFFAIFFSLFYSFSLFFFFIILISSYRLSPSCFVIYIYYFVLYLLFCFSFCYSWLSVGHPSCPSFLLLQSSLLYSPSPFSFDILLLTKKRKRRN